MVNMARTSMSFLESTEGHFILLLDDEPTSETFSLLH